MEKEIHDIIIWENSKDQFNFLLDEIKKNFEVLSVYEISWSKENFEKNLIRFYGPTLANPQKKMKQCGVGSFFLVVFFDPNPIYKFRKTSLGRQMTNINVYDSKRKLRKSLEGEFPIHGSIHKKEANHDITLIFGKNSNDLLNETGNKWDGKIQKIQNDLFGTDGWNSIDDVFYLLNSTTNYVILRNFEEYPNIISEKHPDIDILADDLVHLPFMLNQLNVVEKKIDVPFVIIENKKVRFDFRYVGDSYYDEKWSRDILENKILFKNKIYVPNNEDQFYSLIYHCLIHGAKFLNYKIRLDNLSTKLKIENIIFEIKFESNLKKILDEFMKKRAYSYTNSPKYRIRHNEFIRLVKVASFTTKHEGFSGLIKAIKNKIKRKFNKKENSIN